MKRNSKKVIVALSGGVDSAVAAALLKKQGFEVMGVFLRLGDFTRKSENKVKKIAKKMDVSLKIIDARREFRKKIIEYFINAYKKGITPNPCVKCNEEIKFKLLFDLMKKYKFDYIATGHYAQIFHKKHNTKRPLRQSFSEASITHKRELRVTSYELREAKDKTKDQSYFLYRLKQKDLAKIIFPLGNYRKTEVRKIAKKLKLPISNNKESQDVCFITCDDTTKFLKQNIKLKKGAITDTLGNVLGEHNGLPLYTIGQRRGIKIGPPASRQEREAIRASGPGPYFVVVKNRKKNELVVSNNTQDAHLWTDKFYIKNANWIKENFKFPAQAKVKIRYHALSFSVIIKKIINGRWEVRSRKKIRAVTSGQSAVFYNKNEVIGGGIII